MTEYMKVSRSYAPFTHEHYQYILESALENGYEFISFPMLKEYRRRKQRICLLRHDCDNDLTAAAAIARLETKMGIRSTYFLMLRAALYNLLSFPNAELVRAIIRQGHWIGLHFDEMCYPNASPDQIIDFVDRERSWLSQEFEVSVKVVSFHQPSQCVLRNDIKLNCINTYDKNDMAGVYYLSDSNTVWREGCPSEFFRERRHSRLHLLLHPEWWTVKEQTVDQKWQQMLQHNFELVQQSLLSRERAYIQRLQLRFYCK